MTLGKVELLIAQDGAKAACTTGPIQLYVRRAVGKRWLLSHVEKSHGVSRMPDKNWGSCASHVEQDATSRQVVMNGLGIMCWAICVQIGK